MGHRMSWPWSLLLVPNPLEQWVLFSHESPRWAGAGVTAPGIVILNIRLCHGEGRGAAMGHTVGGGGGGGGGGHQPTENLTPQVCSHWLSAMAELQPWSQCHWTSVGFLYPRKSTKEPRTAQELRDAVHELCGAVTQAHIWLLVHSRCRRIQIVLAFEGESPATELYSFVISICVERLCCFITLWLILFYGNATVK